MIVLALDTAGVDCAVAVYDSDAERVLSAVVETIGKGHAERLMAVLDAALAAATTSLQQVGRIAVTVGPGSFTGIRIGVAAARGLALSLGINAVGISTLSVLAATHLDANPGRSVVAAIDAKRDEIYAQAFDAAGMALGDPQALSLAGVADLARRFDAAVTGSAASLLAGLATSGETDHFPIALVARLGAKAPTDAGKPKPLYLRAPDAKPQLGFAISRV